MNNAAELPVPNIAQGWITLVAIVGCPILYFLNRPGIFPKSTIRSNSLASYLSNPVWLFMQRSTILVRCFDNLSSLVIAKLWCKCGNQHQWCAQVKSVCCPRLLCFRQRIGQLWHTEGYRKPLYDLLNQSNYNFVFVGSQTDAEFNNFSDYKNEGHPGFSDYEIAGITNPDGSNAGDSFNPNIHGIYNWLDQNPADVILLHAGTNNVRYRTSSVGIENILNEINRWDCDNYS